VRNSLVVDVGDIGVEDAPVIDVGNLLGRRAQREPFGL